MRVDEGRIRKEKYTDSKVSGYLWTGLYIFSFSTCVKKWTDILRVYSNGWINLLMPFESGQTDKRSGWAVWSRLCTYKPLMSGQRERLSDGWRFFVNGYGSAVRTADNFLWTDGSAARWMKILACTKTRNNKMKLVLKIKFKVKSR